MFAVSCASCACRCDSCRGFCEGTVLRREELGFWVRGILDIVEAGFDRSHSEERSQRSWLTCCYHNRLLLGESGERVAFETPAENRLGSRFAGNAFDFSYHSLLFPHCDG